MNKLLIFGPSSYVFRNIFSPEGFASFSKIILCGRHITCSLDFVDFPSEISFIECDLNKDLSSELLLHLFDCTHILFLPELKYIGNILSYLESISSKSKIVALSSTACFTKTKSKNKRWRNEFELLCSQSPLSITLLRCNMIFGGHQERSVSKLLRLCRIFPLIFLPKSTSYPIIQPLHISELSQCIIYTLTNSCSKRIYTLSGKHPISLDHFVRLIGYSNGKHILILPIYYKLVHFPLCFLSIFLSSRLSFRLREFIPRFMEDKSIQSDYYDLLKVPQKNYSSFLKF